jgi:hypothetical protein
LSVSSKYQAFDAVAPIYLIQSCDESIDGYIEKNYLIEDSSAMSCETIDTSNFVGTDIEVGFYECDSTTDYRGWGRTNRFIIMENLV